MKITETFCPRCKKKMGVSEEDLLKMPLCAKCEHNEIHNSLVNQAITDLGIENDKIANELEALKIDED